MQSVTDFLKKHLILVLLIILASFLRLSKIDTHGILFFDAAHDLLAAEQAVDAHQLPLQGIASSRPWLHQGPISIWISMLVIRIFGLTTLAQSVTYSLIGIASIIVLYELLTIHVNKRVAYGAVALLTVLPLAVAHSRVPYHTTPIPLVLVIYLWALHSFWKKNSFKTCLLAIFSGLLLIQFELALVPLLGLLPYVFIRAKHKLNRWLIGSIVLAGVLGLLPQIFLQLRDHTDVLISLPKWIVHQVIEVLTSTNHFWQKLSKTALSFWLFGGRVFGVDSYVLSTIGFSATLAAAGMLLKKAIHKKLPPLLEITLAGFTVSTAAYIVVGSPSEAYFPPYFIFVPILISYWISTLPTLYKKIGHAAVVMFVVINTFSIIHANYFVLNQKAFQYESVTENRQIARYLAAAAGGKPYRLTTISGSDIAMPAFFDHIRWFARAEQLPEPGSNGRVFYLEGLDQPQPPESLLLRQFATKRVYWSVVGGEQ